MPYTFDVVDWDEREIKVGMKVLYGAPSDYADNPDDYMVEVISISDPDGDVDDYGRGVMICPIVTVKFNDGIKEEIRTHRTTQITWADYPDGPMHDTFEADDLEVIEDAGKSS